MSKLNRTTTTKETYLTKIPRMQRAGKAAVWAATAATITATLTAAAITAHFTITAYADTPATPTTAPTAPTAPTAQAVPVVVPAAPPAVVNTTPTNYLIDAHDGQIVENGGAFYQFGTAYNCGFALLDPSTPWCGIRIYTSTDLTVWTDEGLAFDPAGWQQRCTFGSFGCFRPHVAPTPTGWVMWVNVATAGRWGYAVLTAPTLLGPWAEQPAPVVGTGLPVGSYYGDHDITVDSDGVGWLAYTVVGEGNSHDIAVEKLNPQMTSGTGEVVVVGLEMVEAPALFQRGGRWYLTYSDPACPYCGGTGTGWVTGPSPLGPWTAQGNRISDQSCAGQPAGVNELVVGGAVVFLYQSDRWQQLPGGGFNPNQAAAETHTELLQFDTDGGILPLSC